jgi:hypothetical protein
MQASGGRSPVSAPTRSLHSTSTVQTHAHARWSIDTTRMQDRRIAMLRPMPGLQVPCVRALVVVVARRRPGQIFACVRGRRSSFRRGHSNVVRACPHLQKATHARGDNETPSHGRESLDRRNCQDPGPGARSRAVRHLLLTRVAMDGIDRTHGNARGIRHGKRGGRAAGQRRGKEGVESGTTAEGPGWIFAAAIGGHGEW